jgi:hypothetical protein
MSERGRTGSPAGRDGALATDDVRRQLEGRAEVIELACERYRMLDAALRRSGWQLALRERRALVAEVLAQEPVLEEALERTRRRAKAEGWPAGGPILTAVRELEQWRPRLHARVRERLGEVWGPADGRARLEEDLALLNGAVGEPVELTLAPGEAYVFKPERGPLSTRFLLSCVLILLGFVLFGALNAFLGPWSALAGLGLFTLAASGLLWAARQDEVSLTTERLLWQPAHGEPEEVRLDSVREGGVGVEPSGLLVVEGDRPLRAKGLSPEKAHCLAFMVEALAHPGMRERLQVGRGVAVDVACFPAVHAVSGTAMRRGWAVLTPRAVYLFPKDAGPELLRLAGGLEMEAVPVPWVVEVLRWLPDPGLETYLSQAVDLLGGLCWRRQDAAYRITERFLQAPRLTFRSTAEELQGSPSLADLMCARRILAPWVDLGASESGG